MSTTGKSSEMEYNSKELIEDAIFELKDTLGESKQKMRIHIY